MRHGPGALLLLVVFLLTSSPAARAAAEGAACFPTCRKGYVCSSGGTCVSECNPPCAGAETCSAGECRQPSSNAGEGAARDQEGPTHFVIVGGGLFQLVAVSAASPFGIASASAGGFSGAFHYELGSDKHRIFVGPRFNLVFYDTKVPEFGLDAGYRARFGHGAVRVGPAAWLEAQLWKGSAFLPYVGAKAGVFVEVDAFVVDAALGGGTVVDTTHATTYAGGVFDAAAEAGIRF